MAGGIAGLVIGVSGALRLSAAVPGIESLTSPLMVLQSLLMALVVGIGAGVALAMKAASLDPVEALRAD